MKMFITIPNKGNWEIKQYLLFDIERQEMSIFQPGLKDPVTTSINTTKNISIVLKGD